MSLPPVSVIVVSNGRPAALSRCLLGLTQLDYANLEIVVVADTAGLDRIDRLAGQIKQVAFNDENISVARNLGLAVAAGEIVAFIDDDAVPEPDWLNHLAGGFLNDAVGAAGGYVIGRNGISFQWTARTAHSDATTAPLQMTSDAPKLFHGKPGRAIKTEGTNMAFRRDQLAALGGFDPVYRFYLDETDVNLRIAARGGATAIVPRARVHHGFEESRRRRADRVPRSLFEIGASLAAFLRRHADSADTRHLRQTERDGQRRRLLDHMVAGRIEPHDVIRLLKGFDKGWEDGLARPVSPLLPIAAPSLPFLPFDTPGSRQETVLSGRAWQSGGLRAEARKRVERGERVTLFLFSPTPRRHRLRFTNAGFWEQTGGLFGASDRNDPVFRLWSFARRLEREIRRVKGTRS